MVKLRHGPYVRYYAATAYRFAKYRPTGLPVQVRQISLTLFDERSDVLHRYSVRCLEERADRPLRNSIDTHNYNCIVSDASIQ